MVRKSGAQTLAVDVFDQLRTAILEGRYGAGARLLPADLSVEYQVSPGVIREALLRLAEQRLAIASPNRGYTVVDPERDDMRDLVELRIINETAAMRLAVVRGDVTWEGEIVAAHHMLRSVAASAGPGSIDWFRAHQAFHRALVSGCGNDRLIETCAQLISAGDLYVRWARERLAEADAGSVPADRDSAREHAEILDAALARDADLAAERYRAHLQFTADKIFGDEIVPLSNRVDH